MEHRSNNWERRVAGNDTALLHPAWLALIRHCMEMGYGEIERIKIQDGVPVLIEKSIERIKLT